MRNRLFELSTKEKDLKNLTNILLKNATGYWRLTSSIHTYDVFRVLEYRLEQMSLNVVKICDEREKSVWKTMLLDKKVIKDNNIFKNVKNFNLERWERRNREWTKRWKKKNRKKCGVL